MKPMLSIDFGNTYTKVGLRFDSESTSILVKDASLKWDDFNVCIPTVAACHDVEGGSRWYYGTEVLKFRETAPGLTVFRNWKPQFFDGPHSKRLLKKKPILVSACHGIRSLPAPDGFSGEAWEVLKKTLSDDDLTKIVIQLGGHDMSIDDLKESNEEQTEPIYKEIGLGFFSWLRSFIDPVCRKRLKLSASEIPARVSLPSFGSITKASMLLQEILSEAGWKLDAHAPVLAEPLANAIGTFTEGKNATHRNGKSPHYGQMFAHAGLLSQMREAALFGGRKTAWILIIDLGGFTADFAMLGLDLEEIDAKLSGKLDGKNRLAVFSRPIGVTDLDLRIRNELAFNKQQALDQVINDPDQQRLESFHVNCFGHLGRYAGKNLKVGDSAREKTMIREIIEKFGQDVADDADDFMEVHQFERIDELILTGGGTMIPAVRKALATRMSHYGVRKLHVYMGEEEPSFSSIPVHQLPREFVRGATAFGGSSVYFDFADNHNS